MMGESKAVARARSLSEASVPLLVGAPSVFELYVGVGLGPKSSEEKRKVEEALESLTQLPLDQRAARRAGMIYAQKSSEGKRVEPEDAMIAGIAVENGQPVLTRNVQDFSGIQDLKVETY